MCILVVKIWVLHYKQLITNLKEASNDINKSKSETN